MITEITHISLLPDLYINSSSFYVATSMMKSTNVNRQIHVMNDYDSTRDDAQKWTKRMGAVAKVKYLVQMITVEPLLGFYMVATILSSFATQNLNLDKACWVNLALNDSVCGLNERNIVVVVDRDREAATAEALTQQLVANMLVWKTILQWTISSVLVVFAGSWSDRNRKRKPCMLVPIVGEFLATIGRLLCYNYYYQLPMEVTAIAETIPASLTGGAVTLTLSVFSYIGDVTTVSVHRYLGKIKIIFFIIERFYCIVY